MVKRTVSIPIRDDRRSVPAAVTGHAEQIEELRQQIEELERRISAATLSAPNLSVYNNVTINVFGQENWDHIKNTQIKSLLDRVMPKDVHDARDEDVSNLFTHTAMLIYSDTTHPENLTAYIPRSPSAQDQVMVYRGASHMWDVIPLSQAVSPMTRNTLDLLQVRQPFESGHRDIADYSSFVQKVFQRESDWLKGKELRAVLVKNGDIVDYPAPGTHDVAAARIKPQ